MHAVRRFKICTQQITLVHVGQTEWSGQGTKNKTGKMRNGTNGNVEDLKDSCYCRNVGIDK
jgi:hypothetical protein